jgi:peroxiredoxin
MATPPVCNFGWPAVSFDLPGTDGKRHRLADVQGPNGLLVMFICNHCPYVKAVIDRIIRDCSELNGHGIGCVAISSNDPVDYPEDSFDNMKRVAQDLRFPFPYLWDETQEVARAYDAACPPDFFGFDTRSECAPGFIRSHAADCPNRRRSQGSNPEYGMFNQVEKSLTL